VGAAGASTHMFHAHMAISDTKLTSQVFVNEESSSQR